MRYNNNVLYQFAFLKKDADTFVRLTVKQTERWNTILQLMQEETAIEQKGVEKVLRSYLNILLYDLDRKFHKHSIIEKTNGKDEKIILFEKLLEENYTTQKTPSFYAKKLYITTNYLNKLCHCYRNVTGGELIRKRITIEAQRLLHYTSLSVAEVAYKLGFESPSYFITFLRRILAQRLNVSEKQSLNEKANNISKANTD
ncbi:MAG: helix-turn-helix domain-containing protein [Chitinophagaceae bacterium]|nr:helix-turn-helix domain-containing protein [Chitinophagaceae bacterium]